MNKFKFNMRDSCPACKSKNSKNILSINKERILRFLNSYYKKDLNQLISNYEYILKKCINCNFIYQEFVLDNLSTKYFYENIEKNHPGNLKKFGYENKNLKFADIIKKNFFENKTIDILDFGSGYTNYPKKNDSLRFFTYDIASDSPDDNFTPFDKLIHKKFDLILLNQVLEHVTDPIQIIEDLSNYLKPNGILKIEFPSSNLINYKLFLTSLFGIKKNIIHEVFPIEHINCFSEESMSILFRNFLKIDYNFKIFSIDQNNNFLFIILKYLMIKNKIIKNLFTFFTFKNGGNYFLLKIK